MRDLVRQHARTVRPFQTIADRVIEESIRIQQIPAPTFLEENRAHYVAQQFNELGLLEIATDELHNVCGLLPGDNRAVPGIMVMAHTDTVFPQETDLTIQRHNGTIHGPGLGDNSIGVAGLLGMVHTFKEHNVTPACDIWFVATSREEGLGNLDGARMAYEALKTKIAAVINVEGLAYGYVYRAGIAVRRLHITAHAEGGHSWLHFGKPSAIHAIVNLGAAITQLNPPENPRTTYNIGIIEGGHSINSIATEAGIWLDMRSEETADLGELENTVRSLIEEMQTDDITFNVEVVGDRPSGQMEPTHPLIQGAMTALEENGIRATLQVGSTDGNIPLSYGCPTVTVGITRGGNAHRTDEFIETRPVKDGMRQLMALTLAAAQFQANSEV
ncbi:MAG: M20/M25/M40 family metallo-hydrolase [Chloroflexota bacterium]